MYFEFFSAVIGAAVGSILSAWFLSRAERKSALRSAYANVFAAAYSLVNNKTEENTARFVAAAESAAFVCSEKSVAKIGELFDAIESNSEDAILKAIEQLRISAHKDIGTQLYK